tara:strand:+ start:1438 stop:1701 length:264 start_codon:yes stop_codon:yes gene_type:complete
MEKLIKTNSMKKLLNKIIEKKLVKLEDLDKPPEGWFLAMGYEKCIITGKWIYINRTKANARSMIPRDKLPKYKNPITGKITFDPTND